ncbi:MAG: D-2-hydroxyacid dehydrogenase [Gammaproteobacteria bacterium]|nr:D-2-hydroxyacid dehydrogenase [Gammaproteobacteria bacterium]
MTKFTGVFLDSATLGPDVNLELLTRGDIDWTFYDYTTADETHERTKDADIVITNKVVLNKATLVKSPKLKLICVAATGMNNIDLDAAQNQNIQVKNVTNYAGSSIAQLVFSYILQLITHSAQYHELVHQGAWCQSKSFCLFDYPIVELEGKTIGLIGYGNLAKSVEKIANAFGMQILIAEHKGEDDVRNGRTGFQQVLTHSDIISLHCPLIESTTHLIGENEFNLMKTSAILINTARGGIVDEKALMAAIKNESIAGAATDVLTEEPPKSDHILLQESFPNLIITPHIAWASLEARTRLLKQVVQNIHTFIQ